MVVPCVTDYTGDSIMYDRIRFLYFYDKGYILSGSRNLRPSYDVITQCWFSSALFLFLDHRGCHGHMDWDSALSIGQDVAMLSGDSNCYLLYTLGNATHIIVVYNIHSRILVYTICSLTNYVTLCEYVVEVHYPMHNSFPYSYTRLEILIFYLGFVYLVIYCI